MKKFIKTLDICCAIQVEIIAEDDDRADEMMDEFVNSENFWEDVRKRCDLWEPVVNVEFEVATDEKNERLILPDEVS